MRPVRGAEASANREVGGSGDRGGKELGYPHPECFGKRGRKLLKTKDGSYKKRRKRLQEIERSRLRAEATGGVCEVCSR